MAEHRHEWGEDEDDNEWRHTLHCGEHICVLNRIYKQGLLTRCSDQADPKTEKKGIFHILEISSVREELNM